ncbi:MAG: LytTR family DNA-binding domain-containing protein [Ferruginibacter sp.]
MDTLRAIIVDDEFNSLENLQQKLETFCPQIKIIAVSQKPEESILLIDHHKPDVLFLDIEMPRMNGFKMIEELKSTDFEIIFTTAYNHYAVEAIRISAFDYLVKPIVVKDLQNCIERLVKSHNLKTRERLDILRQSLNEAKSQEDKIAIPNGDGIEFIQIKSIIRIESSSNYSKLVLANGQTILVTRLLKDFEEMLLAYRFYRVHNSHLINLNCITKYIRGDGGQIVMQNGDAVDVSRRKKEEFMKLIHGL